MGVISKRSPSRDLNTGPADYKSAALPAKPLGRHIPFALYDKKSGEWVDQPPKGFKRHSSMNVSEYEVSEKTFQARGL